VKLSKDQIEEIFKAEVGEMSVSLDSKKIEFNNTYQYEFDVEDNLLERIVLGLDDVDMTLKYKNDIKLFEELRKKEKPWIYADE
jgi:3-isopropylmalate dehydratase small subunit